MDVATNLSKQDLSHETQARHAVLGRSLDFWLMGGASLIFFVICYLFDNKGSKDHFFIADVFAVATIIFNNPHFMVSYKFGYGRGTKFLRENWISLILVPLILFGVFGFSFLSLENQRLFNSWALPLNRLLSKIGSSLQISSGVDILSFNVLVMYFLVGWHYGKQVFGCMMVYAKYDKYPLTLNQRNLVKFNLYSIMAANFVVQALMNATTINRLEIPQFLPLFPEYFKPLAYCIFFVTLLSVLYFVFFKTYKEMKTLPSKNFLIPWLAFMVWWLPPTKMSLYYYFAVPLFHSLQYLPFAYTLERKKNAGWLSLAGLLLTGFLFFKAIPGFFDQIADTDKNFNFSFFLISFTVFINIHHYFIDSVVWKFKDPAVRESLF